jgi:hypothetical protein
MVCSVVMLEGVTPSTSQRRDSPCPTSMVTMRWLADSGSAATLFIRFALPAPPTGVRLSSHSAAGISARIAMNHSSEVNPPCAISVAPGRSEAAERPLGGPRTK